VDAKKPQGRVVPAQIVQESREAAERARKAVALATAAQQHVAQARLDAEQARTRAERTLAVNAG
jgi:hypothetical protein